MKLIDFGMAKSTLPGTHRNNQPIASDKGKNQWKAPEQWNVGVRYPQPEKVDVWALGILVVWLYTGRQSQLFLTSRPKPPGVLLDFTAWRAISSQTATFVPGAGGRQVLRQTLDNYGPSHGSVTLPNDAAADFVVRCLQKDPHNRPTAAQLLADPFLAPAAAAPAAAPAPAPPAPGP